MMREEARFERLQGYEFLSEKLLSHVRTAGTLALEMREQGLSSETKSTQEDIVTNGDKAVSKELQKALLTLFPNIKIIDEEVAESENINIKAEELLAIIDPIDGTGNYFRGSGNWGISMGIVRHGVPVAGIIYQPVEQKMFYAEKGRGAHLNDKLLHVSAMRLLSNAKIRFELPYPKDKKEYEHALRLNERLKTAVLTLENRGTQVISAMDVAEGKWDVFFCMRTKPWDVAAAIVIVTEAGGKAVNAADEPFILGDKAVVLSNQSLEMAPFFHAVQETA